MKDKIIQIILERGFCVNEPKLHEYIDFCFNNEYIGDGYSEEHHILMRSHFPEYIKDSWNLVRLKYEDHIEAHRILAEALPKDRGANCADFFMSAKGGVLIEEQRQMNSERVRGDNNPAKRDEVRKKISESKTGKSRPDMIGSRYFGASEETIDRIRKHSSEVHMNTVPVRLPDGSVIKVRTDDPRYISGELKCIIGAKKGQIGPITNPESLSKFKKSLENRRQKFASMTGEEIAYYCIEMEESGKSVFKNGKLTSNFGRLFKYAGLNPNDFIHIIRQGSTTIESTSFNLVDEWSE